MALYTCVFEHNGAAYGVRLSPPLVCCAIATPMRRPCVLRNGSANVRRMLPLMRVCTAMGCYPPPGQRR